MIDTMYISKDERRRLTESACSPQATSNIDYSQLVNKVDAIFEMFKQHFSEEVGATRLTEDTAKEDDIQVEVDGEIVADTSDEITDEVSIDPETPVDNYGPKLALSNMIMSAITDEYETIKMYNDMIATANNEGFEDVVRIIKHINEEESIHVGMLQQLLNHVLMIY